MIRPLHLGIGLILLGGVACLPAARRIAVPVSGGSLPAAVPAAPGVTAKAASAPAATDADRAMPAPDPAATDAESATPALATPRIEPVTSAAGDPSRTVISAPVRAPSGQDGEAADALSRVLRDQVNQARRASGLQVLDPHTGLPYVDAQHPTRA